MNRISLAAAFLLLSACSPDSAPEPEEQARAVIQNHDLDEASGMQAGRLNRGAWFLHNDDGEARLFVIDDQGNDLGSFMIRGAKNRDWEDLTAAPGPDGPLLVIADMGDNFAQWDHITLYFLPEPQPGGDGRYSGEVQIIHSLRLVYPDGARDCESITYDPVADRLLFLTKRDYPPHIYGISLEQALSRSEAGLELLGDGHRFREPSQADLREFGQRDGRWVSQPTGMDISPDGMTAAVISYRSLYLFHRSENEDWVSALQGEPIEWAGPPSRKEEAVAFSHDGQFVLVTTEGVPAPVYRFALDSTAAP